MQRLVPCLLAALLGLAAVASPAPPPEEAGGEIPWMLEPGPALKAAKEKGRPVLVDLWAIWCVPCLEMDKTTYRDERVLEAVKEVVPLKIDADVQTTFVERYGVEIFPTILFLDEKGEVLGTIHGLVGADDLLERMKVVGEGYARYLELREAAADPAAAESLAGYLVAAGNGERAVESLRRAMKGVEKSDATGRERLELRIAETQLETGEAKAAVKGFQRLAEKSGSDEIRGPALAGIVRAERIRGREDRAAEALERLRESFPDLASSLSGSGS